jgi:GntR family transcriptional regulator, transcriptional repressor for pyruvate dehydrogenase complex
MKSDLSPASLHAETMLEGLGRIKVPKSSDVLAERLKQEILGDGYNLGASLPTERELVSTTGLSRGSVREALRILEAQGLVNTRAGRYGGTTVSQPTTVQLASHVNLYAKGRSVPISALVEVRLALEPMVAALAAERRTDEDLAILHAIAERIDWASDNDLSAFLEENVNWHDAIAAASHNDLLHAFATSVSGMMFEASKIRDFASPEVRQLVRHAHARILEAIEAGDAELARRRVEKDVRAYGSILAAALAAAGDETLAKERRQSA